MPPEVIQPCDTACHVRALQGPHQCCQLHQAEPGGVLPHCAHKARP